MPGLPHPAACTTKAGKHETTPRQVSLVRHSSSDPRLRRCTTVPVSAFMSRCSCGFLDRGALARCAHRPAATRSVVLAKVHPVTAGRVALDQWFRRRGLIRRQCAIGLGSAGSFPTSVRPLYRPCLTFRLRGSRCARFSLFTNLGKLPKCALATIRHAGPKRQRHMLDLVHIFRHFFEARHALLDCPLATSCHEYGYVLASV